jgi:hypothetical protein
MKNAWEGTVKKKMEEQAWWPKMVAKKDSKSLRELSAEFGVSPAAISNAFKRNKIKRTSVRSGPKKFRGDDKPAAQAAPKRKKAAKKAAPKKVAVKKVAVKKVAAKKVAPKKVAAKKVAPKKVAAKKVAPKKVAAKKTVPKKAAPKSAAPKSAAPKSAAPKSAAPKKTVLRKARTAKAPSAPTGTRKRRTSVLAQFKDQMGKVVDREIAEKAGVTVSAVTNYRNRHNIAPATGRGRPRLSAAPTSSAAVDSRSTTARRRKGAQAYQIELGGNTLVVVAANIVEAAQRASAAGKGEVTKIKLLGPALV